MGWFFFLGTLVPMLGLAGVGYQGKQGIADRYAYLPFIGLFIMISWGVAALADGKARALGRDARPLRRSAFVFGNRFLPPAWLLAGQRHVVVACTRCYERQLPGGKQSGQGVVDGRKTGRWRRTFLQSRG